MSIVAQLKKLFIKKPKVIVILGATSTGKSDMAVTIAEKYGGEIISADSRQVYRGMDLGSGKITQAEMQGIHHHLLDVADPSERFSAHDFKILGEKALHEILSHKKIPIICGGTGFYIDTLISKTKLAHVPANPLIRKTYETKTLSELQEILVQKISKKAYARIDIQNKVRVVRALEIVESLGYLPKSKKYSPYNVLFIGLDVPRDELYKRIHTRIQKRIDLGMVKEVENLIKDGIPHERLHELGLEYRHIGRYLAGLVTLEDMIEELYMDTKHFVKRQKTWFKRNKKIEWFNPLTDINDIDGCVNNFLK